MVGNILYSLKSIIKLGDRSIIYQASPNAPRKVHIALAAWFSLLETLLWCGSIVLILGKILCVIAWKSDSVHHFIKGNIANKIIDMASYCCIALIFLAFITTSILHIMIKARDSKHKTATDQQDIKPCNKIHTLLKLCKNDTKTVFHSNASLHEIQDTMNHHGAKNDCLIIEIPRFDSASCNMTSSHSIERNKIIMVSIVICLLVILLDVLRRLRKNDGTYIIPPIHRFLFDKSEEMGGFSLDVIDIGAALTTIIMIIVGIILKIQEYKKYKEYHKLNSSDKWEEYTELALWQSRQHSENANTTWEDMTEVTDHSSDPENNTEGEGGKYIKIYMVRCQNNTTNGKIQKCMEYTVPFNYKLSTSPISEFLSIDLASPLNSDLCMRRR